MQFASLELSLLGVSHRTLGVEQREAFARLDASKLLVELRDVSRAKEAALVSTCNRFEMIAVGAEDPQAAIDFLVEKTSNVIPKAAFYDYRGRDAARHLFRVAASLDSLALGEGQIIGQVKEAYRQAVQERVVGRNLHRLFQMAFSVAKRIRGSTGIGDHRISLSYIAVKLAQKIFDDLTNCRALVLGSGEMAELAVIHLKAYGCREIVVANRTLDRAVSLANQVGGSAIELGEIANALNNSDVVIGSLALERPILDKAFLQKRKTSKALFLIDLGMPRNFSADLAELEEVYLYDLDDLARISQENKSLREKAAKEGELIVDHALLQFENWITRRANAPIVSDFRGRVLELCRTQLGNMLEQLSRGHDKQEVIDRAARSLRGALSHETTELLLGGSSQVQAVSSMAIVEILLEEIERLRSSQK